MKALVFHPDEPAGVVDRPIPEPASGQVRIRMQYVGLCGSDIHYYYHGRNGSAVIREPFTIGHELVGTVDLDASGQLEPGTPAAIFPARFGAEDPRFPDKPQLWTGGSYLGSAAHLPHRQGGACEYLIVDADALRILPRGLPLRVAALCEPLAVALHAVHRAGPVGSKRCLILGAGSIGMLVAAALREQGAADIGVCDLVPEALARAKDILDVRGLTPADLAANGGSFDVVFECSGAAAAVTAAVDAVRPSGRIVLVGVLPDEERPYNLAGLINKEVELHGSLRFADEMDEAIGLLQRQPELARIVTHTFRLDAFDEAFQTARDAARSGKVLLDLS